MKEIISPRRVTQDKGFRNLPEAVIEKDNAIIFGGKLEDNYSPIKPGVVGKELGKGKGSHAHIFKLREKIDGEKVVLKESEWENYQPPLAKYIKLNLKRRAVDKFVTWFFDTKSVGVYPTPEHTMRAYREEYLPIKNYLSPVKNEEFPRNPRQELSNDFKNSQSVFYKDMLKLLGKENLVNRLGEIFERNRDYNFLKNEQTVIALPRGFSRAKYEKLKKENKFIPTTCLIFQEEVEGNPIELADLKTEDLIKRPLVLERLIIFALLQRKMYMDIGRLMDTRPRELFTSNLDWFGKTDNLLITDTQDVVFIDSRWLWNTKTRFLGKQGFNLIDHIGRKSVDRAIKKYLNLLNPN